MRRASQVDFIHWYYGRPIIPFGLDLAWIHALRKPALIEWMGSDIRQPELEFENNPYYLQAFHTGYEYAAAESRKSSRQAQKQFARAGFACGVDQGLVQYVDREIFPRYYKIPRRIILDDYPSAFPTIDRKKPLVLHIPTAPVAKGTTAVLKAVEKVQAQFPFEFHLVQGLPRVQAMELMQRADIVLDQFVLGDYGMATLEAMAFGKPVVCYIKKWLSEVYGPDLPVVNATQETLAEALLALLQDARRRQELGRLGRAYVEQHADMKIVAPQILGAYQEITSRFRMDHV
jgi:glycosyltransferase involved in cell wall biosynthesis